MANREDFNNGNNVRCSFCGKTQNQVRRLVAGPNAYICNECILLCQEIVSDDVESVGAQGEIEIKKPHEIKEVLAEAPGAGEMEGYIRSIGLDLAEFDKLYGAEKIEGALKFAKDLKDRYSVMWMYYDLLVS